LLSEDIEQLGRAVGTYLRRRCGRRINLGRDCRLSGQRLHDALLAGLMEAGCEVTDIGVVPTPLLYYSVYKFGADGGIMITGSHNPSDYNGFKMMAGKAAVYGQDIQDIQALTQSGDFWGRRQRSGAGCDHAVCGGDRGDVCVFAAGEGGV